MNEQIINRAIVEHGTPLYIFYSKDFIENYNAFLDVFRKIYPKFEIAYSYKTNYTPRICQIVKRLGGYAEVVSDMEYMLAREIGYNNEKIIYNGPYKGVAFDEHLLNGGILNIDNPQETERVCALANAHQDKQIKIGIRVNIEVGQNFISRFGLEADSQSFKETIKMLHMVPNIKLVGLHCHIGRSRGVEAWRKRAEIMLDLADRYIPGIPEYIDLGSGMFGRMEKSLAKQFGDSIPKYSDYANEISLVFKNHYANITDEAKPILFVEPGTTIVSSYIDFIGRVKSIKNIRGQDIAVLNCSKDNIGDICTMKRLPVYIYGNRGDYFDNINIAGYTCLEQDVMYPGYSGSLAVGNYILFKNVGGYSNVSKPPFISPNCPMIEIDGDGNIKIIKRAETFEDIFLTYQF